MEHGIRNVHPEDAIRIVQQGASDIIALVERVKRHAHEIPQGEVFLHMCIQQADQLTELGKAFCQSLSDSISRGERKWRAEETRDEVRIRRRRIGSIDTTGHHAPDLIN